MTVLLPIHADIYCSVVDNNADVGVVVVVESSAVDGVVVVHAVVSIVVILHIPTEHLFVFLCPSRYSNEQTNKNIQIEIGFMKKKIFFCILF